ncbi:MAG: serpin family protein [Chloroflexota bacterium]
MRPTDLETLAQGNQAFAIDLYQQLRKADGNLFFSPFSISVALAMTCAGARANTEAQMKQVLHFALDNENLHAAFADLQAELAQAEAAGGVQLKIANSLWPQAGYPFLAEFIALTESYYGVSVTPVNYHEAEAASQTINAWVEAKTGNKITHLISPGILNDLTRLTLVNAIYFKGNWADQFDERATRQADFWSPGGRVSRPMMNRTDEYRYLENELLQALELPYAGNGLSMWILLPKERDGLPQLESRMTPALLDELAAGMRERKVIVSIPKFKAEAAFRLDGALKSLGMTDAFDDKANFAGMNGNPADLYISAALHKAFIEVNEEGSEAAAATAIVMQSRSMTPNPPPAFRADHPFLFLIREKRTGNILFMGRLVDPQ